MSRWPTWAVVVAGLGLTVIALVQVSREDTLGLLLTGVAALLVVVATAR